MVTVGRSAVVVFVEGGETPDTSIGEGAYRGWRAWFVISEGMAVAVDRDESGLSGCPPSIVILEPCKLDDGVCRSDVSVLFVSTLASCTLARSLCPPSYASRPTLASNVLFLKGLAVAIAQMLRRTGTDEIITIAR
jgi:hypothetical protein